MNSEYAKMILQGYHHNREDEEVPIFREALAQVKQDASLSEWFKEERAFDEAISKKLSEVPVPQNLKSTILLGKKMIRRPLWRRHSALLALTACIIFGLFVLVYSQTSRAVPFKQYENDVAQFTATHHFDPIFKSENLPEIRSWLGKNQGLSTFNAPQNLEKLASIGCQLHEISGQKVAVICFWANKRNFEAVHLFVADRSILKDSPTSPVIQKHGSVATASWSDVQNTYILTGIGDENYIKKFL